jgi:hypothetical protein
MGLLLSYNRHKIYISINNLNELICNYISDITKWAAVNRINNNMVTKTLKNHNLNF